MIKAKSEELKKLVSAIFASTGSSPEEADSLGDHLVEANLAGHDSHGVIRAPIYVEWQRDGKVVPNRKIEVYFENETMAFADGGQGFGQALGKQVVELGIEKCRKHGIAMIGVRNCAHLGRIGHWAEMSVKAGLISMHFVTTSGLGMHVVPFGGIDRRLSVNPVVVGIPVEGGSPILFDIAAAASAEGKLKVARNKGLPVPDNTIIDAKGQPTNDPNDFYGPPSGAILPFGGHKGYGLCLVAELLAGAVTGNGCSREGVKRLEQGMLSIFLNPTAAQSADSFAQEVRRYVDFVKTSRPTDPEGEVLVPGEVEARMREKRTSEGIDLDDNTWGQLVDTAVSCGVSQALIEAVAK